MLIWSWVLSKLREINGTYFQVYICWCLSFPLNLLNTVFSLVYFGLSKNVEVFVDRISFTIHLSFAYRKATDFWMLVLCLTTLLKCSSYLRACTFLLQFPLSIKSYHLKRNELILFFLFVFFLLALILYGFSLTFKHFIDKEWSFLWNLFSPQLN